MERFIRDLAKNDEMMECVKNIGEDSERLIAYANEKGYNFTDEDIDLAIKNENIEITDDDLENVVGGSLWANLRASMEINKRLLYEQGSIWSIPARIRGDYDD
jgi:predicted ribosomally synthesized peptide with nif11-like leader